MCGPSTCLSKMVFSVVTPEVSQKRFHFTRWQQIIYTKIILQGPVPAKLMISPLVMILTLVNSLSSSVHGPYSKNSCVYHVYHVLVYQQYTYSLTLVLHVLHMTTASPYQHQAQVKLVNLTSTSTTSSTYNHAAPHRQSSIHSDEVEDEPDQDSDECGHGNKPYPAITGKPPHSYTDHYN